MQSNIKRKNPNALKELAERLKKQSEKEVAVGFPKGTAQSYPDGTSVIEVAAKHVYGIEVPQRDFMELAKDGIKEKAGPIIQAALAAGNDKELETLQHAAGQAGQVAVQEAIVELDTPPNSPRTIAAKGSSNPLIDTGHMKNSVTYVVRDRSRK